MCSDSRRLSPIQFTPPDVTQLDCRVGVKWALYSPRSPAHQSVNGRSHYAWIAYVRRVNGTLVGHSVQPMMRRQ